MDGLLTLIQSLNLDFDRHLRIGVTADGDWFGQVVQLQFENEEPTLPAEEKILASADNAHLSTVLSNLVATLKQEAEHEP